MPSQDPPDARPSLDELAVEYLAELAEGRPVELATYQARCADEAERQKLAELVGDASRAGESLPQLPSLGALFRNRYEIVRVLGAGGMGQVYLARDRELDRHVAIKIIPALGHDHADKQLLLLKESRLLAALHHPSIIGVHDSGLDGEMAYLVMDFVDGRTLEDVLKSMRAEIERTHSGRILPKDGALWVRAVDRPARAGRPALIDEQDWYLTTARIACEIARAIEAAHGAGVLHRDLKPGNVMLTGGGHPVVLDFGLGGREGVRIGDVTERLYGSVPYLAPEQVVSERVGLDARTDVYQLGLILYEMLTLRRAFSGSGMGEVLSKIKASDFPRPKKSNPGVPRALDAICMRALELKPERRYATARALREDLEAAIHGTSVPAALSGDRARAIARALRARGKRHPVVVGLAASVLVGVGVWAAVVAGQPEDFWGLDPMVVKPGEPPVAYPLSPGVELHPNDGLGVAVRSSQDVVLYGFTVFNAPNDVPRALPVELCFKEDYGKPRPPDSYGFEVPGCTSGNLMECPIVVLAQAEEQNEREGYFLICVPTVLSPLNAEMDRIGREFEERGRQSPPTLEEVVGRVIAIVEAETRGSAALPDGIRNGGTRGGSGAGFDMRDLRVTIPDAVREPWKPQAVGRNSWVLRVDCPVRKS